MSIATLNAHETIAQYTPEEGPQHALLMTDGHMDAVTFNGEPEAILAALANARNVVLAVRPDLVHPAAAALSGARTALTYATDGLTATEAASLASTSAAVALAEEQHTANLIALLATATAGERATLSATIRARLGLNI